MVRPLKTLVLAGAAMAMLAAFATSASSARDWSGTRSVASKTRNLTGFSADIGDNGYAVMAYVVPGESLPGEFEGAVFAKVRRPGKRRFRPALFRGITHSPFTDVEIGPGGLTLMTYRGENGLWRASTRLPWGDWFATQQLDGATGVEAPQLRVGREGSAAVLGIDEDAAGDRSVKVSLRDPLSGAFSQWTAVSRPGDAVGSFASMAPSSRGRWTVAWNRPCGSESGPGGVVWVELTQSLVSLPVQIPGSGCVTRGIDLQGDRHGNQFMKLALGDGVQLTPRRHDQPFAPATSVSDAGRTDPGLLGVSGNGRAVLVWGHAAAGPGSRRVYSYVTRSPGGDLSPQRLLKGLRLNRESANDVLKRVSPLPHGKFALAFTRSRFTRQNLVRVKVGAAVWKPGSRLRKITYTRRGPPGRFVDRIGVETSFFGDSLVWWSTQTELTAKSLGYWWRARS